MVRESLPYQGIARMSKEQLKEWYKKIEKEYGIKVDYNASELNFTDGYKLHTFTVIDRKQNVNK